MTSPLDVELFSCPVCYEPLIRKGPPGSNLPAIYRSGFKCQNCNKTYSSKDVYVDLTITAGSKNYTEFKPSRTELFRSPLVSFVYESGWRQNFRRSGFPGPDEEFNMAQEYFSSVTGSILVDISCGNGLFSTKFAKSGKYSVVIALDFSENMLRQSFDFIKKDGILMNTNLALVRADVSRLSFSSASVDAVHAGAALHYRPSPFNAVEPDSKITQVEIEACLYICSNDSHYIHGVKYISNYMEPSAMRNALLLCVALKSRLLQTRGLHCRNR